MKRAYLTMAAILVFTGISFAQEKGLLIDDFEGEISGGAQGTVDFGSGGGSSVDVAASPEVKQSGSQALKVTFDAVNGGYMWVARGFGLDAKNAGWSVKPEEIKWKDYSAISFYMLGTDSQAQIAFDIKDSGGELWRFMVTDNFKGWKQVVCKFADFTDRSDWQPDNADKNGLLDFPLKSYQWEPRPVSKGVLFFDDVRLLK
jgi:beta-glucosidase